MFLFIIKAAFAYFVVFNAEKTGSSALHLGYKNSLEATPLRKQSILMTT
ncbi:hypothetical protein KDJ21_026140 [Metabacillus litoralis]|nr:hypothetical protein [Metabacillus litoralis]UHA60145.1 hypothetical protein KDJ21_026140 [Metabacillus litoralis]